MLKLIRHSLCAAAGAAAVGASAAPADAVVTKPLDLAGYLALKGPAPGSCSSPAARARIRWWC
jgi:hypothetical protein